MKDGHRHLGHTDGHSRWSGTGGRRWPDMGMGTGMGYVLGYRQSQATETPNPFRSTLSVAGPLSAAHNCLLPVSVRRPVLSYPVLHRPCLCPCVAQLCLLHFVRSSCPSVAHVCATSCPSIASAHPSSVAVCHPQTRIRTKKCKEEHPPPPRVHPLPLLPFLVTRKKFLRRRCSVCSSGSCSGCE